VLTGGAGTPAASGVVTFAGLAVDKSGDYTVRATSTGLTQAVSSSFTITPGAADHLAFINFPSTGTAGSALTTFEVQVHDAKGNTVTSDNATSISLTFTAGTGGGAVLAGGTTKTVTNGVAAFNNVSIDRAGSGYRLNAAGTPDFTGAQSIDSTALQINPGSPHHLAVTQCQSTVQAGSGMTTTPFTVEVQDSLNNVVTSPDYTITLALRDYPAGAAMTGTASGLTSSGVASFSGFSLNKTGVNAYRITASATPPAPGDPTPSSADSAWFSVTHGVAHHLAFLQGPTTVKKNTNMSPAVTVRIFDQFDNLIDDAGGTMTLSITPSVAISGNTADPAGGTATFNSFQAGATGANFKLTARWGSPELNVESAAFDVFDTPSGLLVKSYSSGPDAASAVVEKTSSGGITLIPNGDAGTKVVIEGTDLGLSGTVYFKGNPAGTEIDAAGGTTRGAVTWTPTQITCYVPGGVDVSSGVNVGTVRIVNNYSETAQSSFVVCPDGMTYVPDGNLSVTTDSFCGAHNLSCATGFYMGECEVTNGEMTNDAKTYISSLTTLYTGSWSGTSQPVETITWYAAAAYCNYRTGNTAGLTASDCCYVFSGTLPSATPIVTYDPTKKGYRLANGDAVHTGYPNENLILTATAQNFLPLVQKIRLSSATAFVAVAEMQITDSASAWVDSLANPGETVQLDLVFKNYGSAPATALTAVLKSNDVRVTVSENQLEIGDLPGKASKSFPAAFSVRCDSSLHDGEVIQFQLSISTAETTWTHSRGIRISEPVLHVAHLALVDSVSGNANGFAEAGEKVQAKVWLENPGSTTAVDVKIRAESIDSTLRILSSRKGSVMIQPDSCVPVYAFEIQITSDLPGASAPSFPQIVIHTSAANGRPQTDTLTLVIGKTGLAENMESGVPDWTQSGTGRWQLNHDRFHSGQTSWYCGNPATRTYDVLLNQSLESPSFYLAPNSQLKFWLWYDVALYSAWGYEGDGLQVEILDAGQWQQLDFIGTGGALHPVLMGNDWMPYTYDLSEYENGQEMRVRFRFVSDIQDEPFEGVYLDDVFVGAPEFNAPQPVYDPVIIPTTPAEAPEDFRLSQNFPNPFNPVTSIAYQLPEKTEVNLQIFNLLGQQVRELVHAAQPAGKYQVIWDGKNDRGENVGTGVYFYRIRTHAGQLTRKMVLVK